MNERSWKFISEKFQKILKKTKNYLYKLNVNKDKFNLLVVIYNGTCRSSHWRR